MSGRWTGWGYGAGVSWESGMEEACNNLFTTIIIIIQWLQW